jgi:integrase
MDNFKIESKVKDEYLESKNVSTRKNVRYVLSKIDEYEQLFEKSIYNFNVNEVDDFLACAFRNQTKAVVDGTISNVRGYVNFCIQKNLAIENRFNNIDTKKAFDYVSQQSIDNRYIDYNERMDFQNQLVNPQDKLAVDLLSYGVRGRTEKENTHEELCNLKNEDVDFERGIVFLTRNDGSKRFIVVSDYTLNLLRETINQTEYIMSNGLESYIGRTLMVRIIPINYSEYVFRTAGINKFGQVKASYFTQKITKIQRYLDKKYLTVGNLYFSGMVDMAKQIKKERGELIREDFVLIADAFLYGKEGVYWARIRDMVNNYI